MSCADQQTANQLRAAVAQLPQPIASAMTGLLSTLDTTRWLLDESPTSKTLPANTREHHYWERAVMAPVMDAYRRALAEVAAVEADAATAPPD